MQVSPLQAEQVALLDPADGVHRGGDGGQEAGRLRQVREGLRPLPLQTQQILVSQDDKDQIQVFASPFTMILCILNIKIEYFHICSRYFSCFNEFYVKESCPTCKSQEANSVRRFSHPGAEETDGK